MALQPLVGATVQLARLGADDVALEAIAGASAVSDENGFYSIPLPQGLSPAPHLNVVVGPVESPSLRAIVTGATGVDLRPSTTAVAERLYDLLRGRGVKPADMPLSEALQFINTALPAARAGEQGANVAEAVASCSAAMDAQPGVVGVIDGLYPVGPDQQVVESVTPAAIHADDGQQQVTIRGLNFTRDTMVFGPVGSGLDVCCAEFVSPTEVRARVGAGPGLSPGRYSFTVSRGVGHLVDGAQSRQVAMGVLPPRTGPPTLHRVEPGVVRSGNEPVSVFFRILGSGFARGATVNIENPQYSSYTATREGAQAGVIAVEMRLLAHANGTMRITVSNADGVPSNELTVDVLPPSHQPPPGYPTLTGIRPDRGRRGAAVAIVLTGTGLVDPSNVLINGVWAEVSNNTFVSETEVRATLHIASHAAVGLHRVYVQAGNFVTAGVPFIVTE